MTRATHPSLHLFRFLPMLAAGTLVLAGSSCGARTDLGFIAAIEDRPRLERCGDGVVDDGEECDDANRRNDDSCLETCERATCGDGFVRDGFEGCDPGARAACSATCALATCGDGVVDPGEQCDDANDVEGDACSSTCFAATCGNGIVEGEEQCDGGVDNDDRPAAFVVQGDVTQAVTPFITGSSVVDFYDLRSASAHTGFEALGQGNMFLHTGLGGELSLVIIHGIDRDGGGPSQGRGIVTQTFGGIPFGGFIALSDDNPEELDFASPSLVLGQWRFEDNTDGGIIGGLPWPGDYTIQIETDLEEGITSWGVLDSARERRVLTEETTLLVMQTVRSDCRLDCTIPRCSDGILDAGEACDDGNADAGDGCAPDCQGP